MYSFKCGDDSKKKLKGISKSQSKHIKFEEYYNVFFCWRILQFKFNKFEEFINLKSITMVCFCWRIHKKNVIIIFDQKIIKCIVKKLRNQHYLHSMINDVIYIKLKVDHGIKNLILNME